MQTILPLIPTGSSKINNILSVKNENGIWYYYIGMWPVFQHREEDQNSFRFIMASLQESAVCRQVDLAKAFGQNVKRLKRAVKQLRERGTSSFFENSGGSRGGSVLDAQMLNEAQRLLDHGNGRSEVSRQTGVAYSTLSKAIGDGRLVAGKDSAIHQTGSTQSERVMKDAETADAMGVACHRTDERMLAAVGLINGVNHLFEKSLDLPFGGVLCALPALLENSLLNKVETLGEVNGYYTKIQTLMVVAVMLLCRFKTVEQLRKAQPGELGGLLGLDRIPESRCLRGKISDISKDGAADNWNAEVSREWMNKYPDTTGFLYVDGHIKAYSGKNGLPRRYVSRQRLCLKGISYYWVNDSMGQPFFSVERQIDRGMLDVLRTEIVPRLIRDVPGQPSEEELAGNPSLHRFIIVFDREGCSPAFFKEMWEKHRIACLTYRKNVKELWDEEDFSEFEAKTPRGELFKLDLAERSTTFGTGGDRINVSEVRKLTETGKQTTIITTAKNLDRRTIAAYMFARWGQENFFAYAMHHFGIDNLTAYGEENFADPEIVVNPEYRHMESTRRKLTAELKNQLLRHDRLNTLKSADPNHKGHHRWLEKNSEAIEAIYDTKRKIEEVKEHRKNIERHIPLDELPEKEQFMKLKSDRRTLLNTVGMICYRAETAMATVLAENGGTIAEARTILQRLFTSNIDLDPDYPNNILNIHMHSAPTRRENKRLAALLKHLNQTETIFPTTSLRLVYHPHE